MSQLWIWTTFWMMMSMQQVDNSQNLEQATLGAGCFWCVEAVFQRVQGVVAVEAGYTGGDLENPTYQQVVSGRTGHAEVARVTFDPERISFEEILEVFWHTHNPTTLNRQGADVGTQYRSAIFFHDEEQRRIAETSLNRTDASDLWEDPIVTEITLLDEYYRAENYHQDYFNNNPNAGYCQVVIAPKLKKLRDDFPQLWQESIE
ncbi:MAG: peptide-methionine (S)-S-oxide reductase MsrA [Balneolaceae bacterium]